MAPHYREIVAPEGGELGERYEHLPTGWYIPGIRLEEDETPLSIENEQAIRMAEAMSSEKAYNWLVQRRERQLEGAPPETDNPPEPGACCDPG